MCLFVIYVCCCCCCCCGYCCCCCCYCCRCCCSWNCYCCVVVDSVQPITITRTAYLDWRASRPVWRPCRWRTAGPPGPPCTRTRNRDSLPIATQLCEQSRIHECGIQSCCTNTEFMRVYTMCLSLAIIIVISAIDKNRFHVIQKMAAFRVNLD